MKRQKIQIICSPERLKEVFSGPGPFTGFLGREDFQIPYYDTVKIDGISLPPNFPKGMKFFESIKKHAQDHINKFPNCCEAHKKLIGKKWFNKADYKELPNKVIEQLYYTIRFMETREMDELWLKDIKDYIEHNILSFGQLPEGYGCPVGVIIYESNLKAWINGWDGITSEVKESINDFIYNLSKPISGNEDKEDTDLNLLYDTYRKWLSVFPFGIDYFRKEKDKLIHSFPLFAEGVEYNRFIGTVKGKTHTIESLVATLSKMTNHLLGKNDSTEMMNKNLILDVAKHKVDVINEAHRVKQATLLKEFSESEKVYVDVLNNWLQNEREYFKEIEPLLQVKQVEILPQKSDQIRKYLLEYGFQELTLTKELNKSQLEILINKISESELPYQIAMLSYLGFPDFLLNKYFSSQFELIKHMAKWLTSDANHRSIKGNLNVLKPKSNEDKSKYTSHMHKETVKKDYQNLK